MPLLLPITPLRRSISDLVNHDQHYLSKYTPTKYNTLFNLGRPLPIEIELITFLGDRVFVLFTETGVCTNHPIQIYSLKRFILFYKSNFWVRVCQTKKVV